MALLLVNLFSFDKQSLCCRNQIKDVDKSSNGYKRLIVRCVHDYCWKDNIDCAVITLKIIGEIFSVDLEPQVLNSATGLFGQVYIRLNVTLLKEL